jgi:catechol 2,3-dioxygenase-like lactoylglutathione lyase family enzyme
MSRGTTNVVSVGLTVAAMDRSIDFYTTVLSCQKVSDRVGEGPEYDQLYNLSAVQLRIVTLQLGEQTIVLTEFITPKGRSIPLHWRSHDRPFQHMAIVVRDMAEAYQHLCQHQVSQTSPNPQTLPAWNAVAGGIQSFYFKDPDNHDLELIHFPVDKGDPKWQRTTESLFLGIDHTAIVVANTMASRAFYCDQLGLEFQQESQNSGLEQDRLSGIAGARVRISRLQAQAGLGIELLEYVEPGDGCPMPIDTQVNDLWCWQTTIVIETAIEPDPVLQDISVPRLNPSHLTQDADGHTVRLVTLELNQLDNSIWNFLPNQLSPLTQPKSAI